MGLGHIRPGFGHMRLGHMGLGHIRPGPGHMGLGHMGLGHIGLGLRHISGLGPIFVALQRML